MGDRPLPPASVFVVGHRDLNGFPLACVSALPSDPSLRRGAVLAPSDAKDFCRQCLRRRPTDRPSVARLLAHPWITATGRNDSTSDGFFFERGDFGFFSSLRSC